MVVEAEGAAKGLEEERVDESLEIFRCSVLSDNSFGDESAEVNHAREEPAGAGAAVEEEICGVGFIAAARVGGWFFEGCGGG